MTPFFFLGLAIVIPLLGMAVMIFIHWLRRDRWEDGIKAFERRMRETPPAS